MCLESTPLRFDCTVHAMGVTDVEPRTVAPRMSAIMTSAARATLAALTALTAVATQTVLIVLGQEAHLLC
jgi:hypothetical protein